MIFFKIKKSNKEDAPGGGGGGMPTDQMPPLPQLSQIMPGQVSPGDVESRSRSESIRDKTKMISEQLSDVSYSAVTRF